MRLLLFCFFFLFGLTTIWGQAPVNDDCGGLVDLGVVPACSDEVFTNVEATASDIGFGNSPICFNGGTTQNDVWFAFTTSDTLFDLTISLFASNEGANGPIANPQFAIYRGECTFDGLAELACLSAPNGESDLQLDLLGLTPNTTYFIRVNDYSASATPNWGDFTLCVEEYVPAINIGESPGTTACFGTLYDSGGPDGDYGNNELHTFTICPNEPGCIEIELLSFSTEQGFDEINFFAGAAVSAPLIASISGNDNGESFLIQASSSCVTVQFDSDGSVSSSGFELTWSACGNQSCDAASLDNPVVINSLPFNTNASTCDFAATFAASPCSQDGFLNGPEAAFIYESPGGLCANIQVTNATAGTGVLVLTGPPSDPNTICVAQSTSGSIAAANFQDPGTYYIIVADGDGCTDFNISIEEAECALSPALVDALCNPLNGCIEEGGVPSVFLFEDGFQDMEITAGVNDGCWLGVGVEPDFYWFTIQSQADGPFGFILESADNPSDIDFSVWGPFTQEEVCETPNAIVNFITNNQPLRSSWAGGADPTGLADIHPITGQAVTDEYDCVGGPGADGDDFVSTIPTLEGEVYVVLVNDWGNQIGEAGISVDWNPSLPSVLAPPPVIVMGNDTAICSGETVQLTLQSAVDNVTWVDETGTLSCTSCFDPVASPLETTVYKAVVDAVCYVDTVDVKVTVFNVDAGADQEICRGQQLEIAAGSNYENATYEWQAPPEMNLSCTDCPNPVISSDVAGNYALSVTLFAPSCTLTDEVLVTVSPFDAPDYGVSDDLQICEGASVQIGGPQDPDPGVTYVWESVPTGFTSEEANPEVSPDGTTLYRLTVTGGDCPNPIVDSVLVEVFQNPVINVAGDTTICQAEPVALGNTVIQGDVSYQWIGPDDIEDASDPNSLAFPQSSGTYTLTATRGACAVSAALEVTITQIAVEASSSDTVICRGSTVDLSALTSPTDLVAEWTTTEGPFTFTGNNFSAAPESVVSYIARVAVPGCAKVDTITVVVDSLPADLAIMPTDTFVCEGSPVLLTSPIYEPADFPEIEFQWLPTAGQQTPDTLYNMVLTPDSTRQYLRISRSGVCVDTTLVNIEVEQQIPITILPGDTAICRGTSVELIAQADEELENIEWSPAETLSCMDCIDPVATPGGATTYTITVGELGCSSASITIQVGDPPIVALNPNTEICPGESIQLNLDADAISTYTWTSPDDPGFSSDDPFVIVAPEVTTTYQLVAENDNGCPPVEETITVTVVQPPDLSVTPDTVICAGDPVVLTASTNAPAGLSESFEWSYDGNSAEGPTLSVDRVDAPTTFTLTYTYGEDCGTLTETVLVDLDEAVIIDTIHVLPEEYDSTLIIPGGQIFELVTDFSPSGADFSAAWTWDTDGELLGTGTTLAQSPLPGTYTYTFTVTTPIGCVFSDDITVEVLVPLAEMPNAFTPNGDGSNDFFLPVSFGVVKITEFKIYNRWGQLVYDNDNPEEGWDGTHNGEPAPSDVYVYYIVIESDGLDAPIKKQGDVTLLR